MGRLSQIYMSTCMRHSCFEPSPFWLFADDEMEKLNNCAFTTIDRDNDHNKEENCARVHNNGFWFNDCSTGGDPKKYWWELWEDKEKGFDISHKTKIMVKNLGNKGDLAGSQRRRAERRPDAS